MNKFTIQWLDTRSKPAIFALTTRFRFVVVSDHSERCWIIVESPSELPFVRDAFGGVAIVAKHEIEN